MQNRIKNIAKKLLLWKRSQRFKHVEIKNKDVTILCNCCIGGTMYHDLGLQFMTPTINLFFGHHSFIDFVNHLDEYKDAELIDTGLFDINENKLHGPICILRKNGLPDVEIHFLHYSSFDEAKDKWFSRYERINLDKIFCVIEALDKHEHELIEEYVSLPYNKIIFTNLESQPERQIMHMPFYDRESKNEKSVTSLVGINGDRGYDDYDFVENIFNRHY